MRTQYYCKNKSRLQAIRDFIYIFNWYEISEKSTKKLTERLRELIKQNFDIDWIETATVKEIDDKTIRASSGTNYLFLRLNDEETKVNLEIDDGRTDQFTVRRENGNLNVYTKFNGIDYLEVSPDQITLTVYFIHNLPNHGASNPVPNDPNLALSKENVEIKGGVRFKEIHIGSVDIGKEENILALTLKEKTRSDFSIYTFRVVRSPTDPRPPGGFDPQLSEIEFSFKIGCPSEFDCKSIPGCPPEKLSEPVIDYLAKDYSSFRRLILDRLSTIMPDWKERNPADGGIVLVEILAYAADYLSYFQDAVATEAYLGTARKRVSIRRHARLLDYFMHDGCNARVWVQIQVKHFADGLVLPGHREEENLPGTQLLTKINESPGALDQDNFNPELAVGAQVFETMHDITLYEAHNEMQFYTWGDKECCLPKGATRAWLCDNRNKRLLLQKGDVLIFEERIGLITEQGANSSHRHAVRLISVKPEAKISQDEDGKRIPGDIVIDPLTDQAIVEIEWDLQDALPFSLCISTKNNENASVALGNIVLADHGKTFPKPEKLEKNPINGSYYLKYGPLSQQGRVKELKSQNLVLFDKEAPAKHAFSWRLSDVLPAVKLYDTKNYETWTVQRDLLNSNRSSREFVVEMEDDGKAYLRFGDDALGKRPTSDMIATATYRIGNGLAGNVSADAICHVITKKSGIIGVRNPLPAYGGIDPEPIDQVRLYAPQAFRIQERAVTEQDYAGVAQRHPEIQKAVATRRWTGSWYTIFITVDRKGGLPIDDKFKKQLCGFLERFRLAGHDIEIEPPEFVPLDIAFTVCVAPGYYRSDVKKALLETFSNADLPDGRRGFFHPDNFTFGQPVYLSKVVAAIMQVPGIVWVDTDDTPTNCFRRWGQDSHGELAESRISMDRLEVARLDNDPNEPENGKIEFYMKGGL